MGRNKQCLHQVRIIGMPILEVDHIGLVRIKNLEDRPCIVNLDVQSCTICL